MLVPKLGFVEGWRRSCDLSLASKWGALQGEVDWLVALQMLEEELETNSGG